MTNSAQGDRQASVRVVTGTTLDYNGDWSALFDGAGIAQGDWNGRLLQWINLKLNTSYTSVPAAMAAFATNQNATNFSAIGTFDASLVSTFVLLRDASSHILLHDASSKLKRGH